MQARFQKEQDDTKRRDELKDLMSSRQVESKRLRNQLDPVNTRVLQGESDSKRVRRENVKEGEAIAINERAVSTCMIELTFCGISQTQN